MKVDWICSIVQLVNVALWPYWDQWSAVQYLVHFESLQNCCWHYCQGKSDKQSICHLCVYEWICLQHILFYCINICWKADASTLISHVCSTALCFLINVCYWPLLVGLDGVHQLSSDCLSVWTGQNFRHAAAGEQLHERRRQLHKHTNTHIYMIYYFLLIESVLLRETTTTIKMSGSLWSAVSYL